GVAPPAGRPAGRRGPLRRTAHRPDRRALRRRPGGRPAPRPARRDLRRRHAHRLHLDLPAARPTGRRHPLLHHGGPPGGARPGAHRALALPRPEVRREVRRGAPAAERLTAGGAAAPRRSILPRPPPCPPSVFRPGRPGPPPGPATGSPLPRAPRRSAPALRRPDGALPGLSAPLPGIAVRAASVPDRLTRPARARRSPAPRPARPETVGYADGRPARSDAGLNGDGRRPSPVAPSRLLHMPVRRHSAAREAVMEVRAARRAGSSAAAIAAAAATATISATLP